MNDANNKDQVVTIQPIKFSDEYLFGSGVGGKGGSRKNLYYSRYIDSDCFSSETPLK